MSLVVLFFMHLRYSGRLSQTIAIAGLFWFLIFDVHGGRLLDTAVAYLSIGVPKQNRHNHFVFRR
jgi:hypothetical protein